MKKYQLWSRDEYGQGSILMTSSDINAIVDRAKEEVTSINVNNALTDDDRGNNWECYMVMLKSNKKSKEYNNYIYAGSNSRDRNKVYAITKEGEVEVISKEDVPDCETRIYLGDISTKRGEEVDWYAKNTKGIFITDIEHPDLEGKTQLFVTMIAE